MKSPGHIAPRGPRLSGEPSLHREPSLRRPEPLPDLTAAEMNAFRRMLDGLRKGRILEGSFRVNRDGEITYAERSHFAPI